MLKHSIHSEEEEYKGVGLIKLILFGSIVMLFSMIIGFVSLCLTPLLLKLVSYVWKLFGI